MAEPPRCIRFFKADSTCDEEGNKRGHVIATKGQPITQKDLAVFGAAVARMGYHDPHNQPIPIHKRYDHWLEPEDGPYDDAMHRAFAEKHLPETLQDPDTPIVAGMPHGPFSLEFHRLVHGMQITNTGADPINKWVMRAVCLLTTTD